VSRRCRPPSRLVALCRLKYCPPASSASGHCTVIRLFLPLVLTWGGLSLRESLDRKETGRTARITQFDTRFLQRLDTDERPRAETRCVPALRRSRPPSPCTARPPAFAIDAQHVSSVVKTVVRIIIQIQFAAQAHARADPAKRPAEPSTYEQSVLPLPDAPEAFGYIEGRLSLSSSLRVRSFWRRLISVGTSTVAVSQRTLGLRRK